jgi:hypothetical protein
MLGEAYAFGVVWSFAMKALAVAVLRFTEPEVPRWKVPLNLRTMGMELPVGLILITTLLFLLAGINVLTKKVATISGAAFTVVFFLAFTICERYYPKQKKEKQAKKRLGEAEEREEERFRLEVRDHLSPESLSVRAGNILVAVHDPNNVRHLRKVLEKNDPTQSDVVVLSVNPNAPQDTRESKKLAKRVMDEYETRVFSKVVYAAEKVGKPVSLVAVPGKDPYSLILQAAQKLRSSRVVISRSSRTSLDEQEKDIRQAWEQLQSPRPQVRVEIVPDNHKEEIVQVDLDPHLSRATAANKELARRNRD